MVVVRVGDHLKTGWGGAEHRYDHDDGNPHSNFQQRVHAQSKENLAGARCAHGLHERGQEDKPVNIAIFVRRS
jgi:hypothetical protein